MFKNALYAEIDRLNSALDAHITVLAAVKRDNKVLAALNDTFPKEIIRLEEEIDRLRVENKEISRLIDKAADFIGTDPGLRSIACIDTALDHAEWLRRELYGARVKEER